MRKKLISLITAGFIALGFLNCSGMNIGIYFGTQNTNPTPMYGNYHAMNNSFAGGGGVFHRNYIPAGIGYNASVKLHGEACSHSVLYLASWGNSGIYEAKSKVAMQKIAHVEYEQFAIFGMLYHRFCTHLYGE